MKEVVYGVGAVGGPVQWPGWPERCRAAVAMVITAEPFALALLGPGWGPRRAPRVRVLQSWWSVRAGGPRHVSCLGRRLCRRSGSGRVLWRRFGGWCS